MTAALSAVFRNSYTTTSQRSKSEYDDTFGYPTESCHSRKGSHIGVQPLSTVHGRKIEKSTVTSSSAFGADVLFSSSTTTYSSCQPRLARLLLKLRLHSDLGPHRTPCRLANACLECLLGLITALVRYAVKTKEANGRGDPHVAYRIFADVLSDRKSYHLLLPLSLPILLSLCILLLLVSNDQDPCHSTKARELLSRNATRRANIGQSRGGGRKDDSVRYPPRPRVQRGERRFDTRSYRAFIHRPGLRRRASTHIQARPANHPAMLFQLV